MNPLNLLGPWKYAVYAAIAAALIGMSALLVHRYNDGLREEGRAEIRAADKAASEAQTARNIELQKAAEKRYTVVAQVRDHYITETITEVRHEAAALAACPVPEPARVHLNATAECARGDSAAACGDDKPVPSAR